MSAGRGGLHLITTDPMDGDPNQQGSGPVTGPDTNNNPNQGPDLAAARAALAASNRLGVLRPASERSELYASIVKSIQTALGQDESFECLIERPNTGLELVHILVAIKYYELTGKLSRTEARELRDSCESEMLRASTEKKRKHKVTPKDIYTAKKATEAFTLNEAPSEDPLLDKMIDRYEDRAKRCRGKAQEPFAPTEDIIAKYGHKPLGDAIAEAKNTGNFTVEIATDTSLKECSILEAIFWARKLGKLDNHNTFQLLGRCIGSMSEAGVECSAMDFISIRAAGLFKGRKEARKVFSMMNLSSVDIGVFKEEINAALGGETTLTQSAPAQPGIAPSTPTSPTQQAIAAQATTTTKPEINWTPDPSRRGWFPKKETERLPHGALVFLQSRETRRAALEAIALAAILVIGTKVISVINTGNSPQLQWRTQEVAAVEPKPTEPISLGSVTITINPLDIAARTTRSAADTDTKASKVIITPPAPQEQPATTTPATTQKPTTITTAHTAPVMQPPETPQAQPTPQPQPAPQAQPTPPETTPETVTQNTITLPISTKPGAYGGITLDESASKKLWESAGYTVKARMGAGGKKVFALSKNGKSFVISDTKIAEGQAEIAASLEQ